MPEATRIVRVLLIEDNPHVAELICDGLDGAARREMAGRIAFIFDVVGDGQMALDRLQQVEPDLIICDVYMPVMDGAATIQALISINPLVKIIVISGIDAQAKLAKAVKANVQDFLLKPYTAQTLLRRIRKVLDRPADIALRRGAL